jgi:abscisic acid receptor (PYR/PYL family)
VVSLHEESADGERQTCTLVVKSYVVDIPDGSTREDTELFIEALVNCNLKALADVSERLAAARGQHT